MITHSSTSTPSLQAVWSGNSVFEMLYCHFLFYTKKHLTRIIISFCFAISYSTVSAKDVDTNESYTRFSSSALTSSTASLSQIQQAELYGLDIKQWDQYQKVLKGPRRLWSPNIHPLMALGMRKGITEREKRKLAKQYATVHFERVKRELAFEHAVFEAGMKKYGHLPLFREDFSQLQTDKLFNKAISSDFQIQYYVKADCSTCKATIQEWIDEGRKFDIFISGSKKQITLFAKTMGIPPLLVPRQITLNAMSEEKMSAIGINKYPLIRHVKKVSQ